MARKDLMGTLMHIQDGNPEKFARILAAATVVCEYGFRGEPTDDQYAAWHYLTQTLADCGLQTGKGGHLRFARLAIACASA